MDKVTEAINLEADLLLKLKPLPEVEIFEFMKNLRGGTYFNMGMYSSIPIAKAYKSTIRIYKVVDLTAIVSGVSYENVGTTKDFRQATGEGPGKSWYDHTPGFENKVGQKKSDPNSKYVLWDIKRGTGTCVRYYVVDIDTGAVTPVSKDDVLQSDWLTQTEKNKLMPKPVVGIDLTTGQAVENKTVWRTAAFDHIFWLNQAGKSTQEYGVKFMENFELKEATNTDIFIDGNAHVKTKLDDILSGAMDEDFNKSLTENASQDEYFNTPIELLDTLGSTRKEALIDHFVKNSLDEKMFEPDNVVTRTDAANLKKIMASDDLQNKLLEKVEVALNSSDELKKCISEQTATELGFDDYPFSLMYSIVTDCLIDFVRNFMGFATQLSANLRFAVSYDPRPDADEEAFWSPYNDEEIAGEELYDTVSSNELKSNVSIFSSIEEARKYAKKVLSATDEYSVHIISIDTDNITDYVESIHDYDVNENLTSNNLKESYRRIVSRGKTLVDNELFVDFD